MSEEKIDLASVAEPDDDNDGLAVVQTSELLALVRVARAAIVVAADPLSTDAVRRLDAALAPFADSSETKSTKDE